jgi:hypothetical protein
VRDSGLFIFAKKRISYFYSRQCCCWWFQSVYAFTSVSRQDDELSEPNLYTRRSINIRGGRKTRQGWGRPVVLFKWRHHVFAYMLRLIKQYATDGVYLTGTRAAKAYITSEMTWQKNLFDFYLVTCWILNMDVRNFEHFQGVFIIQFSFLFFKFIFPLFLYEQDNEVRRTQPQISSDFQKGIFLLYPNRFCAVIWERL